MRFPAVINRKLAPSVHARPPKIPQRLRSRGSSRFWREKTPSAPALTRYPSSANSVPMKFVHQVTIIGLLAFTFSTRAADWPWSRAGSQRHFQGNRLVRPMAGRTGRSNCGRRRSASASPRSPSARGAFTRPVTRATRTRFFVSTRTPARKSGSIPTPRSSTRRITRAAPAPRPPWTATAFITFSKRGVIHCLDAAKGTVIWSKNLAEELKAKMPTWGFASSVLIEGDLAIVNVGSAGRGARQEDGQGRLVIRRGGSGLLHARAVRHGRQRAVVLAIKQDVVGLGVKDGKEALALSRGRPSTTSMPPTRLCPAARCSFPPATITARACST